MTFFAGRRNSGTERRGEIPEKSRGGGGGGYDGVRSTLTGLCRSGARSRHNRRRRHRRRRRLKRTPSAQWAVWRSAPHWPSVRHFVVRRTRPHLAC